MEEVDISQKMLQLKYVESTRGMLVKIKIQCKICSVCLVLFDYQVMAQSVGRDL